MVNYLKRPDFPLFSGIKWGLLLFLVVALNACQEANTKSNLKAGQPTSSKNQTAWESQIERGNQASQRKRWSVATEFYNKALDLMNNEDSRERAPSRSEIERVTHLASYTQLLAGTTRSMGNCDITMREQVRGVLIKKHLYPVEFEYDSVEFTQAGEGWAEKIAQCLREKKLSGISLIGHTDDRGDEAYNKKLSLRRAKAVEKYLVKQGLSLSIETEGRGEEEPIKDPPPGVAQGDEEYYQLNRRVEMLTY